MSSPKPRWTLTWLALSLTVLGLSISPAAGQCGGVIRLFYNGPNSGSMVVKVIFSPPEAVQAGAGWRFSYCTNCAYHVDGENRKLTDGEFMLLTNNHLDINFKDIDGWDPPMLTGFVLTNGSNTISARYLIRSILDVAPPSGGQSSTGYAGGPFSPTNFSYTLFNAGDSCDVVWWITKFNADWLSLSLSNGRLSPRASTNITVAVNSLADRLDPSDYTGWLAFSFTNSNGRQGGNIVSVSLNVAEIRLDNARLLPARGIAMTLEGATDQLYSIVVSSNLLTPTTNWAELTNIPGRTTFTNQPSALTKQRYFRAKKL